MLFYLSNSLIFKGGEAESQGIMLSVMNIANQAINKIHFLLGDYEAISFFRDRFQENAFLRNLFNNIYQNWATDTIPSFINYYIEVTKNEDYTVSNNHVVINKMNYTNFVNSDKLRPTTLLGEHYNDTRFFAHILHYYKSKKVPNANFNFTMMSGDGAQTFEHIKEEVRAGHILICIVDTDKKYPTDSIKPNSTYGKCRLVPQSQTYKLLPLEVQEIENLIPLNYIDALDWENGFNNADRINKQRFDYLRKDAENISTCTVESAPCNKILIFPFS